MIPRRPLWFLVGLLSAPAAFADVPPPPGYVEPCTVEKQQKPNETCISCSTYFAEADACQKQHAGRGFAHRCRTRGASTWSEVWCKRSTGVDVASTHTGPDASSNDAASPPTPVASASADAAAPEPGPPTPTGPSSPASHASAAPTEPGAAPEKGGSCGACSVGRDASAFGPASLALAALLAAGGRRRARAHRPQRR
ncbi:MAG: hypothetical protein HYZ29_20755 [Myxococcales bacterium]|nr:hypothetical protein [Myxococcales bacterium]